ncbi:MAG: hypothetical protein WDO06_07730 [Actinomycetota bacterium]
MKVLVLTDSPVWSREKITAFEYRHKVFIDSLLKNDTNSAMSFSIAT